MKNKRQPVVSKVLVEYGGCRAGSGPCQSRREPGSVGKLPQAGASVWPRFSNKQTSAKDKLRQMMSRRKGRRRNPTTNPGTKGTNNYYSTPHTNYYSTPHTSCEGVEELHLLKLQVGILEWTANPPTRPRPVFGLKSQLDSQRTYSHELSGSRDSNRAKSFLVGHSSSIYMWSR